MTKIEESQENINNLQVELDEIKNPKFKFKYTDGRAYYIGNLFIANDCAGTTENNLKYGLYRIFEDNAENQLYLNKESNLIGALAEQLDDGWVADWSDTEQEKCCVAKLCDTGRYTTDSTYGLKIFGVNYMSEDVAEKICKILNNKEVEL
jgi:hypothetical protein